MQYCLYYTHMHTLASALHRSNKSMGAEADTHFRRMVERERDILPFHSYAKLMGYCPSVLRIFDQVKGPDASLKNFYSSQEKYKSHQCCLRSFFLRIFDQVTCHKQKLKNTFMQVYKIQSIFFFKMLNCCWSKLYLMRN